MELGGIEPGLRLVAKALVIAFSSRGTGPVGVTAGVTDGGVYRVLAEVQAADSRGPRWTLVDGRPISMLRSRRPWTSADGQSDEG